MLSYLSKTIGRWWSGIAIKQRKAKKAKAEVRLPKPPLQIGYRGELPVIRVIGRNTEPDLLPYCHTILDIARELDLASKGHGGKVRRPTGQYNIMTYDPHTKQRGRWGELLKFSKADRLMIMEHFWQQFITHTVDESDLPGNQEEQEECSTPAQPSPQPSKAQQPNQTSSAEQLRRLTTVMVKTTAYLIHLAGISRFAAAREVRQFYQGKQTSHINKVPTSLLTSRTKACLGTCANTERNRHKRTPKYVVYLGIKVTEVRAIFPDWDFLRDLAEIITQVREARSLPRLENI